MIYLPCGDRRASVCPPCAETYRADTYQLIRAGLTGGKGIPESVAVHPCVFATFTAPSFGPVHTRVSPAGGKVARCRPRRKANYCPHGRRLSCGQRHKEDDACLGRPLCPDCYDYNGRRRLERPRPRTVAAHHHRHPPPARQARQAAGARVRLSFAKVAEFQRRGLIHFHAIFRLDGLDPHHPERTIRPRPRSPPTLLAGVIRTVAAIGMVRHRRPSRQAEGLGHHLGRPGRPPRRPPAPTTARSPTSRSRPTWPSTPPSPPRRSAPSHCPDHR